MTYRTSEPILEPVREPLSALMLFAALAAPCSAATVAGRGTPAPISPVQLALGMQKHLNALETKLFVAGRVDPSAFAQALEARVSAPGARADDVVAGATLLWTLNENKGLAQVTDYIGTAATAEQPDLGPSVSADLKKWDKAFPRHPDARDSLWMSLNRLHESLQKNSDRAGLLERYFDYFELRDSGLSPVDENAAVLGRTSEVGRVHPEARLKPYAPAADEPKTETVPPVIEAAGQTAEESSLLARTIRAIGQALRLIPGPRIAYRGMTGLPIAYEADPTPIQLAAAGRVYSLADRRIRSVRPYEVYSGDIQKRQDEARLLAYFAKWLGGGHWTRSPVGRTMNFNLSLGEARSWGESSSAKDYGRDVSHERNWATQALSRLYELKLVLRAALPQEQRYWPDMFRGEKLGMMTHVPEKDVAAIPDERLVYLVRVNDRWLKASDPRARAVWEPAFRFEKEAKDLILGSGPDAKLEDLAAGLKAAYERSGLADAPFARNALRD